MQSLVRNFLPLLTAISFGYISVSQAEESADLQEMINNTRELRALMQSDPYRPIYHFVAPEGISFPFDPNGAIYWKGKYHLGYLYKKPRSKPVTYPMGNEVTDHYPWGHAVSTDLLHWTNYPDMLEAKEGDLELHIASGGAFVSKDGVPHLIYHGGGSDYNLLASSTDDDLRHWTKLQEKGALKSPDGADPFSHDTKFTVWDPDAWYEEKADAYYQISGGMTPALFKSRDLSEWEYLGDVIADEDRKHEVFEDISCPDFFYLGDGKYMLLFISHPLGAQYYIGDFYDDKFRPEQHGRMSWPGGNFFAAEQLQDDNGRNIFWGWIMKPDELKVFLEGKPVESPFGWSGIMSVPRVASLNEKGNLQITPAEELQSIRTNGVQEGKIVLPPNHEKTLQTSGRSIELKLEIKGGDTSAYGLKVFASPDGSEETVIRYEPETEELVINFSRSAASGPGEIAYFDGEEYDKSVPFWDQFAKLYKKTVSEQRAPLKLDKGETLKLNIFLDRSVIEVFANDRQVISQIVYPELETSTGVKIFSGDEKVTFKNIRSWKMAETNAY